MRRFVPLLLALAGFVPVAHADVGVGVHVRVAPGVFIGARWHVAPAWPRSAPSVNLAVVDTDIRPKHTRLYLDGRFIGLADDFDGFPGFLYLQPGRYRLECRLGGFAAEVVEIDAAAGYRHDVDFHMRRLPGTEKEHWWQHPKRPDPQLRVYGPVVARPLGNGAEPRRPGRTASPGPDLSLRPDLHKNDTERRSQNEQTTAAALRLTVSPPGASVYLDGAFLVTGQELASLAEPLAIVPGEHEIEVMAPGFAPEKRRLKAVAGETLSLEVQLLPEGGRQEETR